MTYNVSDNMKLYHIFRLDLIKLYRYLIQFILYYSILLGIFLLFISGIII